jgi:hypothetical protein
MTHGRHRRRGHAAAVYTALFAVVFVLSSFWLSAGDVGEIGVGPGGRSPMTARAVAAATGADRGRTTDPCATRRERAAELRAAAGAAMQQWRIHVDAMNQLVAGKITLGQAQVFWESSRVEGKRDQVAWHAADAAYRGAADCTGSGARAATCARWQQAADQLFDAARRSLTLWDEHISAMDALRAGKLKPADAERMWEQTWRRAGAGITAYDRAYRTYTAQPACPAG